MGKQIKTLRENIVDQLQENEDKHKKKLIKGYAKIAFSKVKNIMFFTKKGKIRKF
jgi:hypothetical protein